MILPDLLRSHDGPGLTESAYRQLKREIIELRRAPGSSLTEPLVAEEYGLSKTPVREALVRLGLDGLVTSRPRAGYVVSEVTMGDAADLCDLRTILQTEAAALCAEHGLDADSERQLEALTDDTEDRKTADDPTSFDRVVRANFEYEALIANGSRNARLAQAVARMLDDVERVARLANRIDPSRAKRRKEQRRAVTNAIIARNPDAAREAMRVRATSSRVDILQALASSGSLASVAISASSSSGRDFGDVLDGI